MAEDAPGDGKQQFTVEKSTLVDSFCGVEVTVLSMYQSFGTMTHEKTAKTTIAGTQNIWSYLNCNFSTPIDRRIL